MLSLPTHPDVAIQSDRTVWDGRFPLQSVRFRHRRFDGTMSGERHWELWCRGRAVAMLPYDPVADLVVLMEQFRLPALAAGLDPVMIEVPAGFCEVGESVEQTALREMKEEIGLSANRIETIGDFVLSPGGSDERCALLVGWVDAPAFGDDEIAGVAGLAEEQEDIRVRVVPAETAITRALMGHYSNPVTAIALLWLGHKRNWLRQHWAEQ